MVKSLANPKLPTEYLGRFLTRQMVEEMQFRGVDPSGEDNSFHTMVLDGPGFSRPIPLIRGDIVSSGDRRLLRTFLPGSYI